ncbi:MAG: thymidylate kinase [Oscillospiraceae bacterium]|nr:thymidylate kinase [Oscillospiraceae bacterium]
MQGKLIVIEGLDGAGKTTQWELLKKSLPVQSKNQTMFITFPDYNSESGNIIKRYLAGDFGGINDPENDENSAYSASSFYAIDRYISYKCSWGGMYLKGANIISARYTSSNGIYQMTKLPEKEWQSYLDWLYDYEHEKLGIPKPNLTIFLDVPVETSQKLLAKRYSVDGGSTTNDIHEGDVGYLKECRKAALYAANRDNWVKVDCSEHGEHGIRSPEDINSELVKIIGGVI